MENEINIFGKLHDATLISIEFEWASGLVSLNFAAHIGDYRKVRIVAYGAKKLVCPRELPWGRSISVNGVILSDSEVSRLEIEMQSGDVIIIIADKFTHELE